MPQKMQAVLAGLVWSITAHVFAVPTRVSTPGSNERDSSVRTGESSRRLPEQPPQIELIVVPPTARARSPESSASSLGQRLAGWFRPAGVVTHFRYAPAIDPQMLLKPSGQVGIRVWLLISEAASRRESATAHLYFVVERSADQEPKFLWRSVELKSGLDELGSELLIQVVHLSSLALWEGSVETPREQVAENLERESGAVMARASTAAAVPQPVPLPEHRAAPNLPTGLAVPFASPPSGSWASSLRITYRAVMHEGAHRVGSWLPSLGIGYAIRWRGPEQAAAGPEMTLGVNLWSEAYALGIRAAWQSLSTQVIEHERATFETNGNAWRLGARTTHDLPRRFALAVELGTGLDSVRYRATQVQDLQAELAIEPHDLRPFVYLELGLQRSVGPLALGVAGLLAWQIRRTRYGVVIDDRYAVLLTPWRVQPGLRLELSWQ